MARDYKHAKAKDDRRRRSRRHSDRAATPGWVWMLAGLLLGLCLAGIVYVRGLPPSEPAKVTASKAETTPPPPEKTAKVTKPDATSYDFYEMLPAFEVVIPEKELDVRRDRDRAPVREQGQYILQVGAFQAFADAERVKAKLALMGIESRVQKVSLDNQTWHRVRIGPVSDLDELNALRVKLLNAGVEMLIIRSGP